MAKTLTQCCKDRQNNIVFSVSDRLNINSSCNWLHNSRIDTNGLTTYLTFDLSPGSSRERRLVTLFNVSSVAVAVRANTLIDFGRRLLMSPISAKNIRKSSPLQVQKIYNVLCTYRYIN